MKKISSFLLFNTLLLTLTGLCQGKSLSLKELLLLNTGVSTKGIKMGQEGAEFSYEIKANDKEKTISSVQIYFSKRIHIKEILPLTSKGFCLIQRQNPHIISYRYFFFSQDLNHRYELNKKMQIKSLLTKSMPLANKHRPCQLKGLIKKQSEKLKRVKNEVH